MAKVTLKVAVELEVTNSEEGALKIIGREVIAGIATSVDVNANVEDIEVTAMEATEIIATTTNCMPDEELNNLG